MTSISMRWLAMLAIASIATAAVAFGCGVKSPPIPPEEARPERIVDLHGVSVREGIRLSWARPTRYAGGKDMRDLAGFTLMRAAGDEPFEKVTWVPITDQGRFRIQREFNYIDTGATLGHAYRYAVIAQTTDNYVSQPSNVVTMVRSEPPAAPNPENYVLPVPKPAF
jgi:hypothetical protein